MLHLKVTPVVGLPQFTGWSQVAENTTSVNSRLVCVFAVSGKHSGNVGRDVSERIADFYFYDVEQLHEFVENLITYVHDNVCKLYISCTFINGNKSIFITYGGSVFLKRKDKAGQILASEGELRLVQGNYIEGDVFVLTTMQATQFLNEIEQKFIQGFDVDIIITSIVPGLHAQSDSSLSAIVFITKDKQLSKSEIANQKEERKPLIEAKTESPKEIELKREAPIKAQISIDVDTTGSIIESSKVISVTDKVSKILNDVFKKIQPVFYSIFSILGKLIKFLIKKVKAIDLSKLFYSLQTIKKNGIKSIFNKQVNLDEKNNRVNFFKLSIISLIVIIITGFIISFFYTKKKEENRILELVQPSVEQVVRAQSILDSDPIEAREIVLSTLSILQTMKNENSDSNAVYLINERIQKTSDFYKEISGKEELQELNTFYDLRLVKSDYIANDIDLRGDTAVLLDSEKKQLIVLNLDSKEVMVKDFSEYEKIGDMSVSQNKTYVISDGIHSFENKIDSDVTEVRNLGDSNRNANFINAYDRFVYVINPEKRNIYRYSKDENGEYTDPIGWMKSVTGIKYDDITSFSIDGDVWLSIIDGQIRKFTSGREESFDIQGLSDPFDSELILYTNEDLNNLYILESDNNRLVVLDKEGKFIQEFKSSSLASVTTFGVSENKNKIYAVSGSIIFELNLN